MNNKIEESYCSFEVSKQLKEKGFNVNCDWSFKPTDNSIQKVYTNNSHFPALARPTHAIAIEWIRINFGIYVSAGYYFNPIKLDVILFEAVWSSKSHDGTVENAIKRISENWIENLNEYSLYCSPQEAIEAALLYVLSYSIDY